MRWVEVEFTRRALVAVDADTPREAVTMALRGPGAWLDTQDEQYVHTEVIAVQPADDDSYQDGMTDAKERHVHQNGR